MIGLLGGQLGSFAIPGLIGLAVNAMDAKDMESINFYCLVMLGIITGSGLFVFLRAYQFNTISERIAMHLRYDLVVHLIKKDITFYDKNKTGDILSRMSSDV